jgi:hypothetical protein
MAVTVWPFTLRLLYVLPPLVALQFDKNGKTGLAGGFFGFVLGSFFSRNIMFMRKRWLRLVNLGLQGFILVLLLALVLDSQPGLVGFGRIWSDLLG